MKELLIPIITALISGVVTFLTTNSNNKNKLELANKSNEMKIQELNQEIALKDKEIEQLKLEHELALKSKEADVINPIMGNFIEEVINNPSKLEEFLSLAEAVEKYNK